MDSDQEAGLADRHRPPRDGSNHMKVAVNSEKCEGHARCWALLPQVFDTDEYGYAFVHNDGVVPDELREKAEEAVENCPEQAIFFVER
jgi:ferredoxin